MKKKKTENTSLVKRFFGKVGETSGELFGEPLVEWRGKGRVTVSGAKRIGFFSEERIMVLLARERLWVCGRSLMCLSFQNETLVIGGRICSIAYEEVAT
ncbi:MAG: YabP/YqfC family sporulation protein [Clostridia bacterium]|nr:YabP/YqfC family sporulation protein [Clostridia bacterium]